MLGQACSKRLRLLKDPTLGSKSVQARQALEAGAWSDLFSAWSDPSGLEDLRLALDFPGAASRPLGQDGMAFERLFSGADMVGGWLAWAKLDENDLKAMRRGPLSWAWSACVRGAGLDRMGNMPRETLRELSAIALNLSIDGAKLANLPTAHQTLVVWEAQSALAWIDGTLDPQSQPWFSVDNMGAQAEFNLGARQALSRVQAVLEERSIAAALDVPAKACAVAPKRL